MTDSLAIRRRELLARCAGQRAELALDLQALRTTGGAGRPVAWGTAAMLGARLLANRRLALGAAGATLGLALLRPARVLRVVRFAASGWRLARAGMALAARYRA
jgi:hypothetical protein